MKSKRTVLLISGFITATVLAVLIAAGIGKLWPSAKIPAFLFFFASFVAGNIRLLREQGRAEQALDTLSDTTASDLPHEFRFIVPNKTTAQEVIDRAGPYSRITGGGDVVAFEYELPSGYAVLVLLAWPFQKDSKVRGIRMYFKKKEYESMV